MPKNTIGENISIARKRADMTIDELAHAVGLSAVTISKYENDKVVPNIVTLSKIAVCLNTDIEEILLHSPDSNIKLTVLPPVYTPSEEDLDEINNEIIKIKL